VRGDPVVQAGSPYHRRGLSPSTGSTRSCVLHVESERGFSGGEAQVLLLVDGLAARGWRNVLVCPPGSAIASVAAERGVETRLVAMRNELDPASVVALRKVILSSGADLVHLHTGRATWLGGLASWLAGVPAVTTRRMDRPVARGWRTRLTYERLVERVVAISAAVKRCLSGGGVPESRVSVISSAVDPSRLRPLRSRAEVRQGLGASADGAVLLVLAALVRRKGVDVLLQALGALAKDGLRPVLWVAGDGPQRLLLEALARHAGVDAQVRFLGRRPDVPDLLGACDIVVIPSRREGLGVAALEAMAAGRPVIASAVGGLAEAIVDRRTGLLVPPEDPPALANALAELLHDPALRDTLGRAGRRRVAESFSAEQMVEAYVRLYERVLGEWAERRQRA
jgi:glycosyltransferase involved in cell wall biosynthesis